MSASGKIPAVICYDVEDIVAPETDDAALWLAEILREYGLTGSFMVVGEKARLWEQRGRRDVIEALKCHHLGFHSTWHSVHPTTTEICLERNFAEGMDALWEWDRQGWEDTERILGRPLLGWGRTGSSWSPSVQGLMSRLGRSYAYSLVKLPEHNVCWYANCLGFYGGGIGGFDEACHDDALFAQSFAHMQRAVDKELAAPRSGAYWLNLFPGHPTRFVTTMFWDAVNFSRGANPPRSEWKPAPLHPPELLPTIQANYRKLCAWIQQDARLEVVGWGDLIGRYDGQRPFATQEELQELAQRIADAQRVLFSDFFTAAEILLMLCRAVSAPQARYTRPVVFGPLTTPPSAARTEWNSDDLKAAAASVLDAAQSGYLPASVSVGGETIGIGSYLIALAQAFLGHAQASVPLDAPYPLEAESIAQTAATELPEWIIHPHNMDLSNLMDQARLQSWTLKPAWDRSVLFGGSR